LIDDDRNFLMIKMTKNTFLFSARFLLWGLLLLFSSSLSAQTTFAFTADDLPYRNGLELLQKERYQAAREQFREYLRQPHRDLRSTDCEFYIALCGLYLENEGAEVPLEDFITRNPGHPGVETAYLALGRVAFRQKNYDKTITYLKELPLEQLSADEKEEARYKLGYAFFARQKYPEATQLFNSLKKGRSVYAADASYYSGFLAYQNRNYEQALTDLSQAGSKDTYKPVVPYLMSSIYYKKAQYQELTVYAEKALQDKNTRQADEIKLLLADAYFRQGNFAKAAAYLSEYDRKNRNRLSSDATYRLGIAQFKTGGYAQATQTLGKIATQKDSLGQFAAYYLGLSYLKINQKNFALRALEEAGKGKDKSVREEAVFLSAKLNYEQGNVSETVRALKKYKADFPGSRHESEADELLGDAYLDTDNYQDAVQHIENIRNPTARTKAAYQRITYQKGTEAFNRNAFAEAAGYFDKSLKNPSDPETVIAATYWLAECHLSLKNYKEAIRHYQQVQESGTVRNTPYFVKSLYSLGYALYNSKDFVKAGGQFRQYVSAMKVSPDRENYADALVRLADCEYVLKNYKESVRNYDLALQEKTPAREYALFQKGIVLGLDNKTQQAKNTFDNLIQTYPDSPYTDDALFQKAQLDFEQSAYDQAVMNFSKLITDKPASGFVPFALLKRATAYSNLQQYDKATTDYRTVLTQFPTHPATTDALAGVKESLSNAGKSEEMSEILSVYRNANPEAGKNTENLEFESAKDVYFSGKYAKSIPLLESFLQNNPNAGSVGEAKYLLGEAYLKTNDPQNALKFFNQVASDRKNPDFLKAVNKAAEIEFSRENYEASARNFQLLLQNSRNKKEQVVAFTGLMNTYASVQKPDSALFYADKVMQNTSGSQQYKAMLVRGNVFYKQDNFEKAEAEYLQLANLSQDENGAEALYRIGEMQNKQKKYKLSLESLFRVNEKFGSFEVWRSRAFLLVAENYVSLSENFQAIATLKSVIDNSDDKPSVEQAKKRLSELEQK
jgi:TolA-binding protein